MVGTVAVVIAAIGLTSALLGPRIVDEATRLGQKIPQLMSDPNVANTIPLPRVLESQRAHIIGFVQGKLQEGADTALPLARRVGTSVLQAASNLIYIVLIPV